MFSFPDVLWLLASFMVRGAIFATIYTTDLYHPIDIIFYRFDILATLGSCEAALPCQPGSVIWGLIRSAKARNGSAAAIPAIVYAKRQHCPGYLAA
jgi:hypothetical protein